MSSSREASILILSQNLRIDFNVSVSKGRTERHFRRKLNLRLPKRYEESAGHVTGAVTSLIPLPLYLRLSLQDRIRHQLQIGRWHIDHTHLIQRHQVLLTVLVFGEVDRQGAKRHRAHGGVETA